MFSSCHLWMQHCAVLHPNLTHTVVYEGIQDHRTPLKVTWLGRPICNGGKITVGGSTGIAWCSEPWRNTWPLLNIHPSACPKIFVLHSAWCLNFQLAFGCHPMHQRSYYISKFTICYSQRWTWVEPYLPPDRWYSIYSLKIFAFCAPLEISLFGIHSVVLNSFISYTPSQIISPISPLLQPRNSEVVWQFHCVFCLSLTFLGKSTVMHVLRFAADLRLIPQGINFSPEFFS